MNILRCFYRSRLLNEPNMHVELTEKELLSCGLLMNVCSFHKKECPCRLCSIAHVAMAWGCALQVTVSTFNSCCCPLQLFRVVAHWVAMRSWSLVRLNTSLERSVEPPLASMCSLDKEKVFPKIDNVEITDFNFKRNNTLTCSAICRSLALGLLPSGHDGLLVQTLISFSSADLAANSSGCLFGKAAHSPVPVWCLPEQKSLAWERWAARFLAATAPPFLWSAGQHMHTLSVSHPTGVRQRHHFFLW